MKQTTTNLWDFSIMFASKGNFLGQTTYICLSLLISSYILPAPQCFSPFLLICLSSVVKRRKAVAMFSSPPSWNTVRSAEHRIGLGGRTGPPRGSGGPRPAWWRGGATRGRPRRGQPARLARQPGGATRAAAWPSPWRATWIVEHIEDVVEDLFGGSASWPTMGDRFTAALTMTWMTRGDRFAAAARRRWPWLVSEGDSWPPGPLPARHPIEVYLLPLSLLLSWHPSSSL